MIAQNSSACAADENSQLKDAVRTLLKGVGEDVEREGLADTPKRVAKALRYMTGGYHDDPEEILCKAIFNEEGVAAESNGMVVVRDIDFASTCEENLLPFHGRVHIGYIPSHGRVLGLSKMSRLTSIFARRLQTQARLSSEGAAIVVEARHLAHPESSGAMVTSDARGSFAGPDSTAWPEFAALLQISGVKAPQSTSNGSDPATNGHASPQGTAARPNSTRGCRDRDATISNKDMEDAVNSILTAIGEDPTRQGLCDTASTYVEWLLRTTEGFAESSLRKGASSLFLPGLATEVTRLDLRSETTGEHSEPSAGTSRTSPSSGLLMRIPFASQCEHHLLPFYGTATIILLPSNASGLPEMHDVLPLVRRFSRRLQVQERLTVQIADAVEAAVKQPEHGESDVPLAGLLVVCEAKHMCMVARGVEKAASSTLTYASRGCLDTDPALRVRVLAAAASSSQAEQGQHSCCCPHGSIHSIPL